MIFIVRCDSDRLHKVFVLYNCTLDEIIKMVYKRYRNFAMEVIRRIHVRSGLAGKEPEKTSKAYV